MMSLSVTSLSSSTSSTTDRVAKVADLRKHAELLKQQLKQAKTPGTSPEDKSKANSLSQEIINIQSQIDRIILEGQLSKLMSAQSTSSTNAGTNSNGGASGGQTADAHVQPASEGIAAARHGNHQGRFQGQDSNKASSPYALNQEQGQLIDLKA